MRLISLSLIYLSLVACTSMVNTDYDRNTNFQLFKTFNIENKAVRVAQDTRVNSPFMQQRVVNAIETALAEKGFKKTNQSANLKIKYYMDIKHDFETEESAVSIGFGSSGYHSAIGFGFTAPIGETYSIDKLVLTLDMFSTKTDKLIWRGSLAYRLEGGATPESYTDLINDLVVEILKEFPPK